MRGSGEGKLVQGGEIAVQTLKDEAKKTIDFSLLKKAT